MQHDRLEPDGDPERDPPASGVIVGIEQGRERRARRDGLRSRTERGERPDRDDAKQERTEQRLERADRRERRKSDKIGVAAADESATPSIAASDEGVAPTGQPVGADDATPDAGVAAVATAERRTLVAPMLAGDASARTVERTRVQLEQAEQAIATAPDLAALVAPLVRHVNSVTEQLNEAQLTVGKLAAERDALRYRLAEAEGIAVEDIPLLTPITADGESEGAARKLLRVEARDAAIQVDERKPNPLRPIGVAMGFVPATESFDDLKRMARRRQMFAATLLAGVVVALWIASRNGEDVGSWSRDSLAELAYVGLIFQAFIMAWMLYRVVKVGGKGVRWLFPDPNGSKKRRR